MCSQNWFWCIILSLKEHGIDELYTPKGLKARYIRLVADAILADHVYHKMLCILRRYAKRACFIVGTTMVKCKRVKL